MRRAKTEFPTPQRELYAKLCRLLADGTLSSSLLFTGKKGVGKWSVANALAKTITCLYARGDYCGECDSCRQADQFTHPDIFHLFPLPKDEKEGDKRYTPYLMQKQQRPFSDASDDVKSFITIERIREFQSGLSRRASLSPHKVGIIYEAERMLPATMDSLLKTLEEPPQNSYLIVITDQPRFLSPTILSRLQRVSFPPLDPEYVASYLRERMQVAESEIAIVTHFAAGTLYNVEKLADKGFFEWREMAFELLLNALKMSPADFDVKYSDCAALDTREKVDQVVIHWLSFLRDMMVLDALPDAASTQTAQRLLNFDCLDRYAELGRHFHGVESFATQIEKLEQTRLELRRNVNPRMAAFSYLFGLANAKQ